MLSGQGPRQTQTSQTKKTVGQRDRSILDSGLRIADEKTGGTVERLPPLRQLRPLPLPRAGGELIRKGRPFEQPYCKLVMSCCLDGCSGVAGTEAVSVAFGERVYEFVVEVVELLSNRRLDAFVVHLA